MGDNLTFDAGLEMFRRFQNGDKDAFDELVALYRGGLTDYISCFVNDRREAEELTIDAFAELAANTRYKGAASLKTFLFSIGRHLALRHVKKYRNKNHIPIHDVSNKLGACENTVEDEFLRGEQSERLYAAMRALKPEHREALHLVYFENMSYADAAKTMNKTVKQITNLTHRAKAALRKALIGEEEEG